MSYLKESVNGILFSSDRKSVLLVKRRDVPVWVLPGGGIDLGETPEMAAKREFKEETGFEVTIFRKIAVYTPRSRLALFTHFYECIPIGGALQTGDETQEVRFFPLTALPKKLPPPYLDWIVDAQNGHKGVLKKGIMGVTYLALVKYFFSHPLLVTRFLLTKIGIIFNR